MVKNQILNGKDDRIRIERSLRELKLVIAGKKIKSLDRLIDEL